MKDTYTDELDQTTLTPITIDGKAGLTFWTDGGGIRNHLLIQEDTTLTLMTTAELDITPDDETPTVANGPRRTRFGQWA